MVMMLFKDDLRDEAKLVVKQHHKIRFMVGTIVTNTRVKVQ